MIDFERVPAAGSAGLDLREDDRPAVVDDQVELAGADAVVALEQAEAEAGVVL